ncbi:MAG: hypothetical protein ACOCVN_00970 [bacterium]
MVENDNNLSLKHALEKSTSSSHYLIKICLFSMLLIVLVFFLISEKSYSSSVNTDELPLLTIDDFEYRGGFRISAVDYGDSSASYAQGPIEYNPDNHSIFIVGHSNHQTIAEFPVPEIINSVDFNDFSIADDPIQPFKKVIPRIKYKEKINRISGMKYFPNAERPYLLINGYYYYDANGSRSKTTFGLLDANNIEHSETEGAYEIKGKTRAAGWISEIPTEWQNELGGQWITGHAHNMPIVSRASVGPSAFVFDPHKIIKEEDVQDPVPTTEVLGFSNSNRLHDDLSNESGNNKLWTFLSEATYGFIVPGTRSYVTIGRSAGHGPMGICYKCTNTDGRKYNGYGPVDAKDYYYYYWLWDINDLVSAKQGEIKPHEILPYEYGEFPMPIDTESRSVRIGGGSYDKQSNKLYLSILGADRLQCRYAKMPVIAVYSIKNAETNFSLGTPKNLKIDTH